MIPSGLPGAYLNYPSASLNAARRLGRSTSRISSSSPARRAPIITGHIMEIELFPSDNPPKYTIKHIINGAIQETREGEIKYYKSKSVGEQERRLWDQALPEMKTWHSSLPDSRKTTLTVKHKTRYANFTYSLRNQQYGGSYVNMIYVPPEKKNDINNPVVQNTIILLEL